MYVFVIGGRVAVSPNSPVPPPSNLAPELEEPTEVLTKGNQIRLFDVKYPHLPYFRSPLRSGMLFSCLNYKRDTIPIVRVNRMWVIRDDVRKQWTELDKFLTSVLSTLVVKIGLLHLEVTFEPIPCNIPYVEEHLLEGGARGCAYKALRCFQHLFTLCSWAMSYFHPLDQPETGWSRLLLDAGFSPTMVQLLRDSPIGTFSLSPPRLGVVVPISDPEAVIMVPRMVGAHVPVWVWWGRCDKQARRKFSRLDDRILGARYINDHCYPSDSDLAEAVRKSLQQTVRPSSLLPVAPPLIELPKPHHGSGQLPGETWQQFFECQEERHARTLEHESPADKAKREARAVAKRVPGRNRGAKIFLWPLQVANDQVFRLREPINRHDGVSIMENYTDKQMRYNAFDDEWDICMEFDPEGVPEPTWDEDPLELTMPRYEAPSTSSVPEPPSFQPDVFVGNEVPLSVLPSPPPLNDILHQHYGFLCPADSIPNYDSTMSLNLAAKRVCEGDASLPPSNSERNTMCHFLNLLIGAKSIPHFLRDFQDEDILEQYKHGMVIVERHVGTYHLHSGSILRGKYYLIRPRPASSTSARGRFTIFVDDPVAVMHVIRQQWGPHMSDIASQLVAAGIPFSTHVLGPAVPFKPVKFRTSALGYLPFDYQLTAGDYVAYLDRRDTFLQCRYSRAALMKGGIIGRLAREALGDHADTVIRHGPSDDVLRTGTAIQLGEGYYWDDDLVEDEEQLICGVYKMSTGKLLAWLVF